MYRTVLWTLWERVGRFGRMALKREMSCMKRDASPGSMHDTGCLGLMLGTTQRDGMGREEGSGWGTHVYLWWIHVDIWQNQYNIVKLKNKIQIKGDVQEPCGLMVSFDP